MHANGAVIINRFHYKTKDGIPDFARTNKEIANLLDISPSTVKTHVAALLEALNVSNRTEATLLMKELGLDEL